MTRKQFAKAQKEAKAEYQKKCNALAQKYFKARVPLRADTVYESSDKPKRGLTNRFVVFIIQVQHFLEVEMFDVKAGIWWLDKENKCAKWETLHGVDNVNKSYLISDDQTFIRPQKP